MHCSVSCFQPKVLSFRDRSNTLISLISQEKKLFFYFDFIFASADAVLLRKGFFSSLDTRANFPCNTSDDRNCTAETESKNECTHQNITPLPHLSDVNPGSATCHGSRLWDYAIKDISSATCAKGVGNGKLAENCALTCFDTDDWWLMTNDDNNDGVCVYWDVKKRKGRRLEVRNFELWHTLSCKLLPIVIIIWNTLGFGLLILIPMVTRMPQSFCAICVCVSYWLEGKLLRFGWNSYSLINCFNIY